ncbi:hypothetical protein [Spirosoma sp. 209]|uniref:hypothetical protein n=1 Tax=Spirosoma sp. 209 TaxID=1955701 RepID=UPI00098D7458|nr:hypothetical protein [Spirosoma sp. 209]
MTTNHTNHLPAIGSVGMKLRSGRPFRAGDRIIYDDYGIEHQTSFVKKDGKTRSIIMLRGQQRSVFNHRIQHEPS